MTTFVRLCNVVIGHRYFDVGSNPAFRFVPTDASARTMRNYRLLLRTTANVLSVFCEEGDEAALRAAADADQNMVMLEFKVFAADARFSLYTLPLSPKPDTVLYLDSLRAVPNDDGSMRLHQEQFVGAEYFEDWKSPLIQAAVARQDEGVRPVLILNIALNNAPAQSDAPHDAEQAAADDTGITYQVNFSSRTSYWKYYLLGKTGERDLFIADLNGAVEFTPLGMTDIVNGKALTFLSASDIEMQNIPQQRFQLRENGAMGERVLMDRLPNANIRSVFKQMVKQDAVLVSEMYINY